MKLMIVDQFRRTAQFWGLRHNLVEDEGGRAVEYVWRVSEEAMGWGRRRVCLARAMDSMWDMCVALEVK